MAIGSTLGSSFGATMASGMRKIRIAYWIVAKLHDSRAAPRKEMTLFPAGSKRDTSQYVERNQARNSSLEFRRATTMIPARSTGRSTRSHHFKPSMFPCAAAIEERFSESLLTAGTSEREAMISAPRISCWLIEAAFGFAIDLVIATEMKPSAIEALGPNTSKIASSASFFNSTVTTLSLPNNYNE